MSIGALAIANESLLPVWLIWTGISLLLMQATLAGRSRMIFGWQREVLDPLVYLVPLAVGLFVIWGLVDGLWSGAYQEAQIMAPTPKQAATRSLFVPLIPATVGLMVLMRSRLRDVVGLQPGGISAGVMWGLVGITIALPIVWWSLEATLRIWEHLKYDHEVKHDLLRVLELSSEWWVRLVIVLAAVVATPMFEELLFRGLLQSSLRKVSASPVVAIALSSLVFAVIHPPWQAPPIFVLSLMIGSIYELTRNLWAAMVMHAAFNAIAIVTSN